jgi:cytochrome c-type biogenesis protein CcmH
MRALCRELLRLLAVAVLALACALPALAVTPDERLPDAAQEARARKLSAELRCLVCQNQSIDDSDAPLARDLRLIVRERITAGDSDSQIRTFLVARYGEFVLLNPRLSTQTLLLWVLPFLALALGVAFLARRALQRRQPSVAGLTPEEQARVQALLDREQI